ncbi:GMC family oxidoreductase [Aspergillus ibericus CBS 121593]|uniref:glucose oxidase n=1 Tax=Aspergillus ibericus CBS 121593 TaxID=1448316 RepID=A0A395H9A2_9EURO|nr:alcohol oxidase [Aspergillus ibericus CBS 121593]RAL02814.1 alcohol oxidase [Aspergillus ibericus CBS 121593]
MSYTRAENAQIDNWERVGNKGWNWKNLLQYYKKSEAFEVPTQDQTAHGATYDPKYHGENGPLKVGWPTAMTNSSVFTVLNDTMDHLGIHYNPDANSGKMVGFTTHPDTLDRANNIREDAARAYYWPYESRSNLKIITNTHANRIIWSNTTTPHDDALATGIEVTGPYGTETIYAAHEIILSAGALRSPALLELSGIGNPSILHHHNIPLTVALPTVGENLQDQTNNALSWSSSDPLTGLATFSALTSVTHLYGPNTAALAASINASLPAYAHALATASHGALNESTLLEAFHLQHDLIFTSEVPYAEIVFAPSGSSFAVEYWPLQPFSRGSVHITSNNASDLPAINPNYFMFDQDISAQTDVARFIRKALATAPLSGIVGEEVSPGTTLPANASDATWKEWVLEHYRPNYHPVGTASMLPREKGGVVDAELRVYGTKNVRVVDASVLPFQLSGHLTSTLYAVAEKAADLIRGGYYGA